MSQPGTAETAHLVLADGASFRGTAVGAAGATVGEAVFTTGMTVAGKLSACRVPHQRCYLTGFGFSDEVKSLTEYLACRA